MNEETKEKVPVFKSWNHWYVFVVVVLVVLILLFSWFTKHFS